MDTTRGCKIFFCYQSRVLHFRLDTALFLGARTLLISPNNLFWKAASFSPARVRSPQKDDGFLGV